MAEMEVAGSGAGGSPEAGSGSGWRRPHGPLQRYYGPSAAEAVEAAPDPTDINGPHFDPEVFLTKVTFDPTATSHTHIPPREPPRSWWRPRPQTPPTPERELRGPRGRPQGPCRAPRRGRWDPCRTP